MLNQLKEDLDREMKALQELECSPNGLNDIQTETLRYKVQLLNSTLARIMTWWRQRAKVKWIENGDGNTHLFHSMASARRRAKCIDSIKQLDGTVVTENGEITRAIHSFFEMKWRGNAVVESGWPSFENQRGCLEQFSEILENEVTREEIWIAVCSLGRNKAPGRDGVTASFFKFFWNIVGEQVMKACLEFFESGIMDPQWKETVVVLLPKVNNPDQPSKFRPISLCQTIYKIVAKVLVNRFKGILPR